MLRRYSKLRASCEALWLVSILLVACALALGGCGSSHGDSVLLTIGARATPEEEVLGHIYARALRDAGYSVNSALGIETELFNSPLNELRYGYISGYPEHLSSALSQLFAVPDEDLPKSPRPAYLTFKAELKKQGFTAFAPTPFSLDRRVGLLRQTAEERDLHTISDLKGKAEKMTVSGEHDCHFAIDCLAGLEKYYRIYFESISYMYSQAEIQHRYKALEDKEVDASFIYGTDGHLARGGFVLLEDDEHALPAGNVVFVTSPKVVKEAGPKFEKTILDAQRGLTLPVMQQLDAEVELDGKSPAAVAAAYLQRTERVR